MRVPVMCDVCRHLAHMEWVKEGWLTRCTYCVFATFNGKFGILVVPHEM